MDQIAPLPCLLVRHTDTLLLYFAESVKKMQHQNVTIALPADLLREARHLAVDRGISLSRFVSMMLVEQVEAHQSYRSARERQQRLLEAGLPLGTGGHIDWRRDQLHER